MSPITTHVLDTSIGKPAAGIAVMLERKGSDWELIASAVTDDDGRVKNLMSPETEFVAGDYRLIFKTESYFRMREIACFFPEIVIVFTISDMQQHYHVPLLLSPFVYSTYRGS